MHNVQWPNKENAAFVGRVRRNLENHICWFSGPNQATLIIWCFKDSTHFDILHLLKHLSFRCDSPAQKLCRYLAVLFGDGELWDFKVLKLTWVPSMKLSSLRSPILQHPTLIFARILINWQLTTERLGLPDDQTQLSVAHIDHRVVAGIKHDLNYNFTCLRYT